MTKKIIELQKLGFQWKAESPFLIVMHHVDKYPAGNAKLGPATSLSGRQLGQDFSGKDGFSMYHGDIVPGFPTHPHRGFETVTIVQEGFVDHFDSVGAKGRYGDGDVQWLTTGSGCQHAEMFPLIYEDRDNPLELFQIWLNLPSYDKMTEPDYKMLWAEDIPVIQSSNIKGRKTTVRLISGSYKGIESLVPTANSWANRTEHHVGIMVIEMEPEAEFKLPAISDTLIRNLYFYQGEGHILIEEQKIENSQRVKLSGADEIIVYNGDKTSYLLLLEGEPINEPVAQYGPFVMNTAEEIQAAYRDYQNTEFGGWPWNRYDPVNDREVGRYAQYADGRVENR